MNWRQFQEQGYDLTEAEIKKLYPDIIRSYQEAKKRILADIKEQYVKYLSAVDTDDYYNEMLKYDRLLKIEAQISADFVKASREAEKVIYQAERIGFSNMYYRSVYASMWLAPSYSMTVLPEGLIQLATLGTVDAWKKYTNKMIKDFGEQGYYASQIGTLKDLLHKNRVRELAQIKESIIQGLIRGDSYTQMSGSISDVIGSAVYKDGVQHFSGAMANSMRIVSTETSRVMNDAAFANMKQLEAQGIDIKKMWSAVKDARTRPTHAGLDGIIKLIDQYYTIGSDKAKKPGGFSQVKNNVNCRCTILDIINDQPPTLMRGRNPVSNENEVLDWKPFGQWADDVGLKVKPTGEIVG